MLNCKPKMCCCKKGNNCRTRAHCSTFLYYMLYGLLIYCKLCSLCLYQWPCFFHEAFFLVVSCNLRYELMENMEKQAFTSKINEGKSGCYESESSLQWQPYLKTFRIKQLHTYTQRHLLPHRSLWDMQSSGTHSEQHGWRCTM